MGRSPPGSPWNGRVPGRTGTWFDDTMTKDPPPDPRPETSKMHGRDVEKTRVLLASVEELRALLAPLTREERARVLALARQIREQHSDRPDQ
jgi:hypothetical protein